MDCREGSAGDEPVDGVRWKKPRSVFWPEPEDCDFFNEGVEAGPNGVFLGGMAAVELPSFTPQDDLNGTRVSQMRRVVCVGMCAKKRRT